MQGSACWDSRDPSWLADLVNRRTDGLKLSLKLYHGNELQLTYQQLMTEALPNGNRNLPPLPHNLPS